MGMHACMYVSMVIIYLGKFQEDHLNIISWLCMYANATLVPNHVTCPSKTQTHPLKSF